MRTTIVDHVMSTTEVEEQKWTYEHLYNLLPPNNEVQLQTAASVGLIPNRSFCSSCERDRILYKNGAKGDGFAWKCPVCKKGGLPRMGSFLQRSHLTIKQILVILLSWSMEMPQIKIKQEASVSNHTIVDWMSFIREVCEQDMLDHPIMLGGRDEHSTPKEVEVDESYFFRRKYNRGRVRKGVWLFGAVERGSNLCNFAIVENRDRDTLFPIINSWCLPGTRIISDGWAAYQGLDRLAQGIYEHDTVVHEDNFVDPLDPSVHTQTIEGLWSHAKKHIRKFGNRQNMFGLHLMEFLWRKREKGECFPRIIRCIREQYSF